MFVSSIHQNADNNDSPLIRVLTLSLPTTELLCLSCDTAHEVLTHGFESLEKVSATFEQVEDKRVHYHHPHFLILVSNAAHCVRHCASLAV